jgi:site-specific DNA-adenine methylase
MKNLGMPYQGSKSRIATQIVEYFPQADTFVDLFFGGGAVTHAAMLSGKFHNFIANDLRKTPQAWNKAVDALDDEYDRFVSKEEFLASDDMIVKMLWSFGASCRTYADAGIHELAARMIMSSSVEERYSSWLKFLKKIQGHEGNFYNDFQRINSVTALRWLKTLEGLLTVIPSNLDYREVEIPKDSVVYCDPPYSGTQNYGKRFDHDAFWEWCRSMEYPVYVSEMAAPDDFISIWSCEKTVCFNKTSAKKRTENLFLHRKWVK